MNHNIYFLFSILSLVLIAPFGAINPLIALAAVGIAGVFFFIWYLKEMKEQEKNYKKELDKESAWCYNNYSKWKRGKQNENSNYRIRSDWPSYFNQ